MQNIGQRSYIEQLLQKIAVRRQYLRHLNAVVRLDLPFVARTTQASVPNYSHLKYYVTEPYVK